MAWNIISPNSERVMDPEFLAKYNEEMAFLSRPECSFTLLYEPHLIPNNKGNNTTPPSPKKIATPKKIDTPKKMKISEKFLTSVRSLTSSGMLDGVEVRYLSKTKKVELSGKIQGPSYLCGCQSCNYTRAISACEFENHAGCKTSHANNHIHFANGNSMHMVTMKLNCTPEAMLFDALQDLTGCSIDHQLFSAWIESFQAA